MASGKLEKMLVLAFESAEKAETGGIPEAKARFDALINPESYALEYKVKTSDGQGQGTRGAQVKFEYTLPEELTFDFLFDNTGLIDGKPKPNGVFDDVDAFRKLLTEYHGVLTRAVPPQARLGEPHLQGPGDRGRHHLQAVQPRRPADPRGGAGQVQGVDRGEEARRSSRTPLRRPDASSHRHARGHAALHVLRGLRRPAALPVRRRRSTSSTTSESLAEGGQIQFPPLPAEPVRR